MGVGIRLADSATISGVFVWLWQPCAPRQIDLRSTRRLLAPIVKHRAAIVDETALGELMYSIDDYDGWPTITAALKFVALTCTRPGEVRHLRRNEIDTEKKIWRIPAERMNVRKLERLAQENAACRLIGVKSDKVRAWVASQQLSPDRTGWPNGATTRLRPT